jgi:hypothetical protein
MTLIEEYIPKFASMPPEAKRMLVAELLDSVETSLAEIPAFAAKGLTQQEFEVSLNLSRKQVEERPESLIDEEELFRRLDAA